jgi:hypothetical protein
MAFRKRDQDDVAVVGVVVVRGAMVGWDEV